jgi:A/G-specific adenine glycosylase
MKAFEVMVEDASDFSGETMFLVTKKELESLAVPSAFRVYTDWYALRQESF